MVEDPQDGVARVELVFDDPDSKSEEIVIDPRLRHDLVNLLQVAAAQLDIATEDHGSSEALDVLGDILGQVARVVDRPRREEQLLELCGMLRDALPTLRAAASPECVVCAELHRPAWVSARAPDLKRVLLNLVQNACEAGSRSVVVSVDTGPWSAGGARRWARLSVGDAPVGMSSTVLRQAFEPGFTTRSEDGGRGLGLPSVVQVVARAGGRLRVTSQQGSGTMVTVFLPLIQTGSVVTDGEAM